MTGLYNALKDYLKAAVAETLLSKTPSAAEYTNAQAKARSAKYPGISIYVGPTSKGVYYLNDPANDFGPTKFVYGTDNCIRERLLMRPGQKTIQGHNGRCFVQSLTHTAVVEISTPAAPKG